MTVSDMVAYHKLITNSYDKRSKNYDGNRYNAHNLVDNARPSNGGNVLDIGTGTGIAAFHAASYIGKEGTVIGIDISEGMISEARKRLKNSAFDNMRFEVMDGENLTFEKNKFDNIYCASAFFWIVDKEKTLAHWLNFLKPGGVVGFHAWPENSYVFGQVARKVLMKYGTNYLHHSPTKDMEKCQELLHKAGYGNIQIIEKKEGNFMSFKEAKDSWINEEHYPIAQYPHPVSIASPEILEKARIDYIQEMDLLNTDKGVWNNTSFFFCYGEKGY